MGTETCCSSHDIYLLFCIVKLNNPLLGTEIKGGESIMGGSTFGRPR